MIYSDKQRRISNRELEKLRVAISGANATRTEQAWLLEAERRAIRSEIVKLEADIAHYDLLKAGEIGSEKSFALESLPTMLVEARIAAGMSQTKLAELLGVKPQQIQRYEASGYMGASLARLVEVSAILDVKIEGLFESEPRKHGTVLSWDKASDVAWQRLPIKEMKERGWFELPRGRDPVQEVKEYFERAAGPRFAAALHRKKIRGETSPSEYGLLAWQVRVLELARAREAGTSMPDFMLEDGWLPELVALTRFTDGPSKVTRLLASKGIVLVTEPHLTGTYLDGAAMLGENDRPIIGLTLRYDRLDNFWFVLFHELGHVFLHLMGGLRYDFFDEDGASAEDSIELEADRFALNHLISEKDWNRCLSRFGLTEEAVRLDAERFGVHPSIIAGRIRRERNNYTVLNALIGLGQVNSQFARRERDSE